MAFNATCKPPSVPFLKPIGIDRPDAISRWVWLSVVRAPTATQDRASAMYCGDTGSRASLAAGMPLLARSNNSFRPRSKPVTISKVPSKWGSLIMPFQPTVVRGFSKYTRITISNSLPNFSRSGNKRSAYS